MNELNLLLIKEDQVWIAQCLQYDITAQGNTIKKAISEFHKVLAFEIAYSIQLQKPALDGIPSAPQYYWKLYEEAGVPIVSRNAPSPFKMEGLRLPETFMLPKMRELRAA